MLIDIPSNKKLGAIFAREKARKNKKLAAQQANVEAVIEEKLQPVLVKSVNGLLVKKDTPLIIFEAGRYVFAINDNGHYQMLSLDDKPFTINYELDNGERASIEIEP